MKRALIKHDTGYVDNIIEIADNVNYNVPDGYYLADTQTTVNNSLEIGGTWDGKIFTPAIEGGINV
jgi:hypothetical protein